MGKGASIQKVSAGPALPASENTLVRLLQGAGAVCTALGAMVLMVEGLGRVDAIARFFSFSGILVLCAGLGLLFVRRRGDTRSARILLTMFLALVPVFWSQLGAVIYELGRVTAAVVPQALRIEGVTPLTAVCGGALAAFVIAPFSALVARVLIPVAPVRYTSLFLILGLLLCIPDRSGLLADLILVAGTTAVLLAERRTFSYSPHYATPEARWARAALLAIPAILVGRAMFYGLSESVIFAILTLGSAACYLVFAPQTELQRSTWNARTDIAVSLGVVFLVPSLGEHSVLGFRPSAVVLHQLNYIIPAAFLIMLTPSMRASQAKAAALIVALGSCLCRQDPWAIAPVMGVLGPLAALALGVYQRSSAVIVISVLAALVGSSNLIRDLLDFIHDYRWSALMVGGIFLVAGAPFAAKVSHSIKGWLHGPTEEPVMPRGEF